MASTSNQTDSSYYVHSSSSFTPRWNVFLSFRGEDTRGNFTGHLYKALDQAGIQTFMDDPELPRGEEISPALLKAIQESEISIVVISENYASSTWCLDELMRILECRKTKGQLVLPVFYKVNPSDVRHQCGSFAEAFEKHKIRFVGDMDKVEKWRATLTETSLISGHHHLDANGNEPKLIDQIVDWVQVEVNPRYLNVAKKPVGIASHVKNIMPLLSIGSNGVRKIGIYGMGGVGKTTVAKAVYNENFRSFEGSCFLANVREVSRQPNGIVRLQEQLLFDVLKSEKFTIPNVDNGISLIGKTIQKRVLIVLDDLNHLNQLDSLAGQWNRFTSGSIIMITTRDARLLDQIQVDGRYEVEELNNNDSLELFSLHAFGKTIPPSNDFMELSWEIIDYAGGLPLALEVFGSNLFNQDKLEWTSFIKKLRENPNSEIEGKLEISFNALENVDRKDIFLDIACFFIGRDKDEATTILSACYSCAENDIGILIKKCLLKCNDQNELIMHDLLQDLGREIARNKFPREPQKYSRLWRCEDIRNVLEKDKGTESIEGIVPYEGNGDKMYEITLNTKTFERMHRLRLLDICGVNLTGSFEHIFEELRWLRWDCSLEDCSLECLPSDFHPEKLVILDLSFSDINMLCNGNLFLEQLKILNLSFCKFLKTTGDISGLASLEKLDLMDCTRLVEVHPSIEYLGKLVCLDLRFCPNLTILTSRVCNLRALEDLYVSGCSNLEGLPEELGNMESIRVLKATATPIKKLPDSIGQLSKLVELDLRACNNLRFLPDNICNLRALKRLELDNCASLERLPQELGSIESLEFLSASRTSIVKLPDSIGLLRNLVKLDLSYCGGLINLPSSIGQLRGLECLILDGCSNLESLPEELGKMECLTKLSAWSLSIKNLPDSIGQLSKLVKLDLSECGNLRFLPDNICNLRALERLKLGGCSNLEWLPQELGSIESLDFLWAEGTMIIQLPDSLGRLTKLSDLDLHNCKNLRNLPSSICNLRALGKLNIDGCSNLIGLPEELGKMESLRDLRGGNINLKKIPDSIGDMKNLIELHLPGRLDMNLDLVLHPPFTRFVPPSITGLCSLKSLNLRSCYLFDGDIPDNIGSLSSLEILNISDNYFSSLPSSLVQLSNLIMFNLGRCKRLRSLPGIPPYLCVLHARDCISLEKLPNLSSLEGLVRLELTNCSRLVEIQGLENLKSLKHVGVEGCDNLESTFRESYRN